jgi:hypothetical protein
MDRQVTDVEERSIHKFMVAVLSSARTREGQMPCTTAGKHYWLLSDAVGHTMGRKNCKIPLSCLRLSQDQWQAVLAVPDHHHL